MLSSTARFVSCITVLTLTLAAAAQADQGIRLTTVAAEDGYTYQWMPTEAGAMLARPGVRIIIRAGRLFYEVNNATPIADSAPRFDGRDLIISPRLAVHLRELARIYPYPPADAATGPMSSATIEGAPSVSAPAPLTLQARHIPGRDAIALQGTGPANVPVTITVRGELSTDVPIVVISRKTVLTATDGSFSAEVEYGQDSHVGTALVANATTLSGASSPQARFVIGVPSPQIKASALDVWPSK